MKQDLKRERNKVRNIRHKYKLIHYFILIRETVRSFHLRLNTLELGKFGETPYSMFRSWLLDIIQYGLILYIMLFTLGLRLPLYSGFGMGIAYWFVLHELKEIRKAIN